MVTIFVFLLDEGVDVWRPVDAEPDGPYFRIMGEPPDDERWQFQPGDLVRCETRTFSEGPGLAAVERVG